MEQDQSEIESRLDDMLSRIAMETLEIKELEQQLTDGQILANEALKRDLEGVISGLQQYLKSLRAQTSQAQVKAQSLQAENRSLRRHLKDTQRHCRQLEEQATAHTQVMSAQQDDLSMLHSEAATLRDTQAQLEAEVQHLRAELDHQVGQNDQHHLQQTVHDLQTRLERFTSELHDSGPESPDRSRVEDLSRNKSQSSDETLSEGHRRDLHRLNRKLQELRRVMCETDPLSGEQLLWVVDQVTELNCAMDRLKGQYEDTETCNKHVEVQPDADRTRTKTGSKTRSKPRTETRSGTRLSREEGAHSHAPNKLTNVSVGSGGTLDSGLDLHLLSSPERAPPTGAAGNWHYSLKRKEHRHQHHHHFNHRMEPGEGKHV